MKAKKNSHKKSINNTNSKKASMKNALSKIVDVVKKPFQKAKKQKTTAKKPKSRKEKIFIHDDASKKENNNEVQLYDATNDNIQHNASVDIKANDIPFAENSTIIQMSRFFYSNDKFIETFDDNDLYEAIITKYPGIIAEQSSDQEKRKTIIEVLNDNDFMQHIFDNYHMNVMDFFRFLFRLCPSVFKGFFIKKIQKTIRNKRYAKSIKFAQYSFQKGRPRKAKHTRKYLPI